MVRSLKYIRNVYLWPCCNDIGGIDLLLEEAIDCLVLID